MLFYRLPAVPPRLAPKRSAPWQPGAAATRLEPISLGALGAVSRWLLLDFAASSLSGALTVGGGEGQAEGNLSPARGPVKAQVDRASFEARPGEGVGVCGAVRTVLT